MACEYDQHTSEYNSECDSFPCYLPWRTCNTVLFLQLCVLIMTHQVCLSLEVCRYISRLNRWKMCKSTSKVSSLPLSMQKWSSTPLSMQSVHLWVTPGTGIRQLFESWSVPNLWMLTTICIWWETWCQEVLETGCLCNMSWRTCNTVLFLQLCVLIMTHQVCLSLEVCRYISRLNRWKMCKSTSKVSSLPLSMQKWSSTPLSMQSVHLWVTPGTGIRQLFESWSVPNLWMLTTICIWWETWCQEDLETACLCNMSWGLVETEHGTWETKIK